MSTVSVHCTREPKNSGRKSRHCGKWFNDGNRFRRLNGNDTISLCRWIINNDYPNDIQVLCFNCNWGKHLNGGICPHKRAHGVIEDALVLEASGVIRVGASPTAPTISQKCNIMHETTL